MLVRVDGPYGEEEEEPGYINYPTLALFAGGIGVRASSAICPLVCKHAMEVLLHNPVWFCLVLVDQPSTGSAARALRSVRDCVQITPVLGVVQDLSRRRGHLRKGATLWPARAHLFFTGRSAAELAILQDSIVCEARSGSLYAPSVEGTQSPAVCLAACMAVHTQASILCDGTGRLTCGAAIICAGMPGGWRCMCTRQPRPPQQSRLTRPLQSL